MKKTISIMVALALTGFLIYGITFQKKKIPVEKPGTVIATPAYEKSYGPAPTVDKGTAYAFVIYFPSAKESGKIVPFPFFTFDEGSIKKVAVERLLSGMETGSYQGEFLSAPPGSRIVSLSETQGTVILTLSKEIASPNASQFVTALIQTLRQFKGVSAVSVKIEGSDKTLASEGDDSSIIQPGPPRLLSVTAMKDKGAKEVEEVNAFFDRPVDVKELKLLAKDDKQYEGDLYHSAFDMAGVLKPKDRSRFTERMPIKVRWKVVDKLGRQAEGDNVWFLEVKEH
ncbi:GerMN domain-containing protein [Geobacter pelophilus]|uniref:GerMN domain-containing protein n=1 Tax=Geoanaerobacter pelophilus TaxID=60036 RepID=A0AAW4L711_9BACT|nr:GerMN domain-containing protein [Geoanaerobacter pelophilus]MBT0663041.1 GerMN domain-containing protein [Geoanaerobacter pelophilus]